MTKKNQLTYVSLLVFFLILVGLGTMNKTQEPIVYNIVEDTIIIPDLPSMDGTPTMALNQLPMLIELPVITGIASPTEDKLPHLTLPPLQDF
jgi:hypothetical protein|tara:strand:- start:171 stop:446 length:276 start_codon:yes stop_codon:yes gene_type:complete